jgi:capsid protein
LNCTASYTAAKDEANNIWKGRLSARTMMARRMNQPVYVELLTEAIMRGRVQAPGFFDDYAYRRAWTRSAWVGAGQGSLDPLRESKANVINLNSFLATHEEIYQTTQGGRWDSAMDKRAREESKLEALGLKSEPDPNELIGPDGQMDEDTQQDGQNA